MPYYGDKNQLKQSNVNYVGRDFNELKSSLMQYVQSYFPNTYKDFNETSPGMMLIELSAYVGDVLNFYVDQQYKELLLPLAEEKKNILNIAKTYGYKAKPISPSYVTLTVKQTLSTIQGEPNYSEAAVINKGMQVNPTADPNLIFETLDVVDFRASSSIDSPAEVSAVDGETGQPSEYVLTRKVKAVSGESKVTTFEVGVPTKFLKLTILETNVIEIIKVADANGNIWHEVDTLAQDKVPIEKHYTSDSNRADAYTNLTDNTSIAFPVPFSLEYLKTSKRFMVEVEEDGTTSLIFGNGILKNGNTFNTDFFAVEQIGINLPGGEENMEGSIDPLMGDSYGTLGEAPSHIIMNVTYRMGGGISSNTPANALTNIAKMEALGGSSDSNIIVTNNTPAVGGSSGETVEEIRYRAIGHFSTQNRCVTKSDFEARTLNMAAKFGNIAKVYCARSGAVMNAQRKKTKDLVERLKIIIDKNYGLFDPNTDTGEKLALMEDIKIILDADQSGGLNAEDFEMLYETLEMTYSNVSQDDRLYTVDLYLLSYDNNKNLINTPNIVKQNLKQYLDQYRMLTDQVSFYNGYVINFGVVFDVVARPYDNKDEVKFRCIQEIQDYFTNDKMQFKQIIYTRTIENLLSEVDGVKSVNYVTLTQDIDYNSASATETHSFSPGLYTTLIQSDGTTSTTKNKGYGYYYDFSKFYGLGAVAGFGVVLPAYEPAVFELKNPKQNIKGIVR